MEYESFERPQLFDAEVTSDAGNYEIPTVDPEVSTIVPHDVILPDGAEDFPRTLGGNN